MDTMEWDKVVYCEEEECIKDLYLVNILDILHGRCAVPIQRGTFLDILSYCAASSIWKWKRVETYVTSISLHLSKHTESLFRHRNSGPSPAAETYELTRAVVDIVEVVHRKYLLGTGPDYQYTFPFPMHEHDMPFVKMDHDVVDTLGECRVAFEELMCSESPTAFCGCNHYNEGMFSIAMLSDVYESMARMIFGESVRHMAEGNYVIVRPQRFFGTVNDLMIIMYTIAGTRFYFGKTSFAVAMEKVRRQLYNWMTIHAVAWDSEHEMDERGYKITMSDLCIVKNLWMIK